MAGETLAGACTVGVGAAALLGAEVADINGDAVFSAVIPATASGQVWYAVALFPDTCEVSCVSATPIP